MSCTCWKVYQKGSLVRLVNTSQPKTRKFKLVGLELMTTGPIAEVVTMNSAIRLKIHISFVKPYYERNGTSVNACDKNDE